MQWQKHTNITFSWKYSPTISHSIRTLETMFVIFVRSFLTTIKKQCLNVFYYLCIFTFICAVDPNNTVHPAYQSLIHQVNSVHTLRKHSSMHVPSGGSKHAERRTRDVRRVRKWTACFSRGKSVTCGALFYWLSNPQKIAFVIFASSGDFVCFFGKELNILLLHKRQLRLRVSP